MPENNIQVMEDGSRDSKTDTQHACVPVRDVRSVASHIVTETEEQQAERILEMTAHRKFAVTTICGSMRFWPEIQQTAHDLTEQGWIVLMPLVHVIGPEEQKTSNIKKMLDEMHLAKIDMSDAIHIVSRGEAMPGRSYAGESTKAEIKHAETLGKIIYYVM